MRSFRLDKRAPTKAFQNITARGPEGWGVESLPSNLLCSWGVTLNFSFFLPVLPKHWDYRPKQLSFCVVAEARSVEITFLEGVCCRA